MTSEMRIITIATVDGPLEWPAWTVGVPGLLATPWVPQPHMAGFPGDGWAVTHEPTGLKVADVVTAGEAYLLATLLARCGDWTDTDAIRAESALAQDILRAWRKSE